MTFDSFGLSVMYMRWFVAPLLIVVVFTGERRPYDASPIDSHEHVDFEKHVLPILQSKCQPCHFAGGKMYSKLPFDQPGTIIRLGEKLFTRIKDERSRTVIRTFLAERTNR